MNMSLKALKDLAKDLGITGVTRYSASQKEDIVDKIIKHGGKPSVSEAKSVPRKRTSPVRRSIPIPSASPRRPDSTGKRAEYEAMSMTKLKEIAKDAGVPSVYKYKLADKDSLIDEIMSYLHSEEGMEDMEDIDASSDIATSIDEEEPIIEEVDEEEEEEPIIEEVDEDEPIIEEVDEEEPIDIAGPSDIFKVGYLETLSLAQLIYIAQNNNVDIPDDAEKEDVINILIMERGTDEQKALLRRQTREETPKIIPSPKRAPSVMVEEEIIVPERRDEKKEEKKEEEEDVNIETTVESIKEILDSIEELDDTHADISDLSTAQEKIMKCLGLLY